MAVYLPFLLPVSLSLPSALYFFNCVFSGQKAEMWNGLRVSYIQFHYLSLSLEPITWRASPLGVCDSNLSGACGGLTLSGCRTPPPHPTLSLSLLCSVPLCPSTLANRGNYALNWHPVYTLNRHQLQLCDTRTSMLSLPLHFPRSLSATHPANGK